MKRRNFLAAAAAALPLNAKVDALPSEIASGVKITGMETDVLRFAPGRPFAPEAPGMGSELQQSYIDKHKV